LYCPVCEQSAVIVVSEAQAFCGNDECVVLAWDPRLTREQFHADCQEIELPKWMG
jgi:hypothetical protein